MATKDLYQINDIGLYIYNLKQSSYFRIRHFKLPVQGSDASFPNNLFYAH